MAAAPPASNKPAGASGLGAPRGSDGETMPDRPAAPEQTWPDPRIATGETVGAQPDLLGGIISLDDSRRSADLDSGELPVRAGDARDPLTVEQPGRYQLRREFGRGGQAIVWLAFDAHVGRELAFKQLLPSVMATRAATRFLREARVTGQLEHPAIVPVYELGRRPDGTLYYTQKLVRGRTLHAALQACQSLADRLKLLPHFVDVCQALAYAHGRGVIHRDIKPENVMVGEFGETVVLDWGLAKVKAAPVSLEDRAAGGADRDSDEPVGGGAAPGKTAAGTVLGTPMYMSPEQANGNLDEVDEQSDVWALGAVLFEILAGRPPFQGATAREVIAKVAREQVPDLKAICPEAPPELTAVVDRALQRERPRRYASARELAAEIEAFMTGGRVRAYEYGSLELFRRFVAKNKVLTAVSASAVLALLFASAVIEREHRAATAHLAAAQVNLAEALIEKARGAEKTLQWPRAAAYYAAARIQRDSVSARWGQSFTERLAPRPAMRIGTGQGAVWGVAALADGRIATGGDDGTLRIWDPTTGAELRRLTGHKGQINSVIARGTTVITAGVDGTVRLWDAATGHSRSALVSDDEVWAIALSRDGKLLATGSMKGEIRLWDRDTLQRVGTLTGHDELVTSMAFGAGGELASASFDGTVRIWRGPRWAQAARLDLPGVEVWSVAISPDGRTLAAGGSGATLRLFQLGSAEAPIDLDGHERDVIGLDFADDGTTLASTSRDTSLQLWDAHSGRGLARVDGHERTATAAAFLPGSRRLATSSEDGTAIVWELPARELGSLTGHTSEVRTVGFSPGNKILASGGEDGTVRLWDFAKKAQVGKIELGPVVRGVVFSAAGDLITAAADDRTIHVYDATTLRELRVMRGHEGTVECLAAAPAGTLVATASDDGTVKVWDARAGALVRTIVTGQGKVRAVTFSPDGKLLASAGTDSTVRLWDAQTGEARAVLIGHDARTRAVAFSPDGRKLASGGNDRDIIVWEVPTGRQLLRMEGHLGQIRGLLFTRDGLAIASASADRSVLLWDAASGAQLVQLAHHTGEVLGIALSADGATLASAARDKLVFLVGLGDPEKLKGPEESFRELLAIHGLRMSGLRLEQALHSLPPPAPLTNSLRR